MKCLARLVMAHIRASMPGTLDHSNFPTVPTDLQKMTFPELFTQSKTHLEKRNTYVRMLLIDYSLAFNTIASSKLVTKLRALGLETTLCNWNPGVLDGQITGCEV
jgi:hypothetical protein